MCTLTQHDIYTSVEIVYLADSSLCWSDLHTVHEEHVPFSMVACGVDNF